MKATISFRLYALYALLVAAFMIIYSSGCATSKIPIYIDQQLSQKNIDSIVLLPVVDARKDKSFETNLDQKIRTPIRKILEKKGYSVITPDKFSKENHQVTPEEIIEMDIAELSTLDPSDAKILLIVYVEDVSDAYVVLAHTFKIEASAVLIDKINHSLLWKDKAVGVSGQGGLISGLFIGMNRWEAISFCLDNLFSSFPEKVVNKK